MLEQFPRDDDVEALVGELERPVEVGPVRLDPQLRRLGEGFAVGVDADDLVPGRVGLCERTVPAAEVEHATTGAAHVAPEERLTLRPGEDEPRAAFAAVVLGISLAQLIQAHTGRLEQAGSTLALVSTSTEPRPAAPVEDIRSARP